MAKRSMKKLTLGLSLAGLLAAGAGNAQSAAKKDDPQNPNSIQNANRPIEQAPAETTKAETQSAEQANPHSTLNAARPAPVAPVDAATSNAQVQAANPGNPHSIDSAKESKDQGALLQRLHVANQAEIDAGALAQANGGTRAADYGRMLVADHGKADQKLLQVASRLGVTLADQPTDKSALSDQADGKKTAASLQKLSGAAFDKEFGKELEGGHKKVIAMIEAARPGIKDADLGGMLDEMLPTLKHHQQMAHDLRTPMAQGRSPR